jgi:putative SOS response-associated peptidase YedK
MCGRFVFNMGRERFEAAYQVQAPLELRPRFNIAPTQQAAVIRLESGQAAASLLEWGIRSHGKPVINARSETALEKPLFRQAMQGRRCVVPATGWYEWRKVDGEKYPYHLGLEGGEAFGMAGVWTEGQFSVLTTRAAEGFGHIHDRMPVVLSRERWRVWLEDVPLEEIQAMCVPFDSRRLDAYLVGRAVGNVRNDGEDLLEKLL